MARGNPERLCIQMMPLRNSRLAMSRDIERKEVPIDTKISDQLSSLDIVDALQDFMNWGSCY